VREALADVLAIEALETLLEDTVEARRRELAAERRGMRESFDQAQDRQMEQREGAQAAEWLRGIDDLSPGSFDLLTVTVYYPA